MDQKLREVIHRALSFEASLTYFEIGNNAASPHMDAELELQENLLIAAIGEFVLKYRDEVEAMRKEIQGEGPGSATSPKPPSAAQ